MSRKKEFGPDLQRMAGITRRFQNFCPPGSGSNNAGNSRKPLSRNPLGAAIGYEAADVGEFSEGSLWAQ